MQSSPTRCSLLSDASRSAAFDPLPASQPMRFALKSRCRNWSNVCGRKPASTPTKPRKASSTVSPTQARLLSWWAVTCRTPKSICSLMSFCTCFGTPDGGGPCAPDRNHVVKSSVVSLGFKPCNLSTDAWNASMSRANMAFNNRSRAAASAGTDICNLAMSRKSANTASNKGLKTQMQAAAFAILHPQRPMLFFARGCNNFLMDMEFR
mmetsp:Transcript_52791/g.171774  ORF Transcript_52791/g.171774 Transcript_52791/m.171774 type:complete len:208 (-) Transcript_52791:971-1594(-)